MHMSSDDKPMQGKCNIKVCWSIECTVQWEVSKRPVKEPPSTRALFHHPYGNRTSGHGIYSDTVLVHSMVQCVLNCCRLACIGPQPRRNQSGDGLTLGLHSTAHLLDMICATEFFEPMQLTAGQKMDQC